MFNSRNEDGNRANTFAPNIDRLQLDEARPFARDRGRQTAGFIMSIPKSLRAHLHSSKMRQKWPAIQQGPKRRGLQEGQHDHSNKFVGAKLKGTDQRHVPSNYSCYTDAYQSSRQAIRSISLSETIGFPEIGRLARKRACSKFETDPAQRGTSATMAMVPERAQRQQYPHPKGLLS